MRVESISKQTAQSVVGTKHYSRRLGIFWEAFGLFIGPKLVGVCVYGQPSAPVQRYSFRDRDFRLYELTRLVVDRGVVNGASFLIANSLKKLKERPAAIISYADSQHGHCGIVYQATNWLYTGAVTAHDSLYVVDGVALHPMTIRDKFGVSDPARWAKDNGIPKVKPEPKHRYFQFVGNKGQIASMRGKLAYVAVSTYPKVAKSMYDDTNIPCQLAAQGVAFLDELI